MLAFMMCSGTGWVAHFVICSFQALRLRNHGGFLAMMPPGQEGTPMAISCSIKSLAKALSSAISASDKESEYTMALS